jgi:hypothetical protein
LQRLITGRWDGCIHVASSGHLDVAWEISLGKSGKDVAAQCHVCAGLERSQAAAPQHPLIPSPGRTSGSQSGSFFRFFIIGVLCWSSSFPPCNSRRFGFEELCPSVRSLGFNPFTVAAFEGGVVSFQGVFPSCLNRDTRIERKPPGPAQPRTANPLGRVGLPGHPRHPDTPTNPYRVEASPL